LLDLGVHDEGLKLLEQALAYNAKISDSRYSSKIHSLQAMQEIIGQDFRAAAKSLERAEIEARRTNLPVYIAFTLFFWADYHLATRMPEEALKVIAEAEAVLERGKALIAGTQGNICRLIRYRAWKLGGYESEGPLLQNDGFHLPLSGMVGLVSFREWVLEQTARPTNERPNTRDLIKATGLAGLRSQLEAVGMFPLGRSPEKKG
jgi:hypothetical protein